MKKANGSDILLEVLYDGIRSWYISQENHLDYDSGGGIMDYKLQHKSYGSHCLDSVILVEKHFSLFRLSDSCWEKFFILQCVCFGASKYLNLCLYFPAIYNMQNCKVSPHQV